MSKFLPLFAIPFFCFTAAAQQYTVNGSASQDDCNCYTLTPAQLTQSGSVWNNFKIDLTQSFTFTFDVFLGGNDANGADGIAFVLQPVSTSIGSSGSGLGYQGITPAVGVTLDTWQNTTESDPTFDHIAIQLNGDLFHNTANNIAGPVTMLASGGNAEDNAWHILKVEWNALTKAFDVYFDGSLRVNVVKDFVADVFGGNPMVFWGFTGSTGGALNLQKFCTALSPGIKSLASQNRCINEPITFYDSTISFAPVVKRYWNFGDGSPIDSININPVHTYTAAGDYVVTLTVVGADGCVETQTQPVRIGSKPVAAFTYNDSCVNNIVQFTDASAATVGNINSWYWELGNGATSAIRNPATTYITHGFKTIRLAVRSEEGCASDTLVRPVYIHARPVANFTFTDSVCLGTVMQFTGTSTLADAALTGFTWIFPDTAFPVLTKDAVHLFTAPGSQTVTYTVGNTANCVSTIQKNVFVVNKPTAFFNNGPVCLQSPVQLQDSSYTGDGTAIQQWWWSLGNGQFSAQQNPSPVFTVAGPDTIRLVVRNSRGCVSDTFTRIVTVNPKPVAVPKYAKPLCAGQPVQLLDSSVAAGGTVAAWQWLFSNGGSSTQQNPQQLFAQGAANAQLVVTAGNGCRSDTGRLSFIISPKPTASFTSGNGCVRDTIRFSATSPNAISAWIWNYGDGVVGSTQNTNYVYLIPNTYTATLVVKDTAGCFSDTVKRTVVIAGTNANAGLDVVAAAGQPVQLQAGGGISYSWSPPTGLSNPNIPNPVAVIFQDVTYTVTVSTPQGCTTTDKVTVFIYKGPDIYVPTAFSPNGDGRNDFFRAIPVGITKFENLSVFNRYGQNIFFTSNAAFGWDGTWQGQKQPQGAYVWFVSGVDYKGERIFKKGTVMLIR